MNENNPALIPRNHIIEKIINESMKNNFKPLYEFVSISKKPYKETLSLKKFMLPPKTSEKILQTYCGT